MSLLTRSRSDRPVRRLARRMRSVGADPHAMAALAGLALVLAFYAFTAFTSAKTFPTQLDVGGRDYFNLLTDAFLHGQTDLLIEPSPRLLALEDPYDATKNIAAGRLHDLSLYEGRYYLYWPPTPVLTSFLPGRALLLGRDLPERAAIVIYMFVGLLITLALVRYLVRRHLPGTPRWMLALAGLALATANVAPYVLRRPTVYEVAISAGFCFTMAAAYLLLRGALEETGRLRRLLGGSVCLGLAIGARVNLAVAGTFAVAAFVYLVRSGQLPTGASRRRAAAALFGPAALAIVLLLAYNALRFDDPSQLGLVYQLNDLDPYPPGGFGHVLPSLFFYLLAPAQLDLNFPFFHLAAPPGYPGTVPAGFNREPVSGLIPTVPIVLLALVAVPLLLRSSLSRHRELGRLMLLALGVGSLLVLVVVVPIYSATMRYSMDFTTLFLVCGLLAWMLLAQTASNRRLGRLVAVGGAGLILYSATFGIAISFTGEKDGLRAGHPGAYARLERAVSFLPVAATAVAGRPVITEVGSRAGVGVRRRWWDPGVGDLLTLHIGRREPATLEIVSPGRRKVVLRARALRARHAAGPAALAVRTRARPEVSTRLPVTGATADAGLTLERGINHVELRAVRPPAPPAGQDPALTPTVTLHDVRLAYP